MEDVHASSTNVAMTSIMEEEEEGCQVSMNGLRLTVDISKVESMDGLLYPSERDTASGRRAQEDLPQGEGVVASSSGQEGHPSQGGSLRGTT